jgi:hypothetical protein
MLAIWLQESVRGSYLRSGGCRAAHLSIEVAPLLVSIPPTAYRYPTVAFLSTLFVKGI